jgi:LysR family transcriptional activator of nhaA
MQVQISGKSVWLNYSHLYYFKIISTEGSIAKASKKLRLGQPTLSAQLKQLEENLGAQLFDRQHKRLILNETGKIVQDYANEIFRIGSEMIEVVHDKLPARRVHVQIGALDSVPKHLTLAISKAALRLGNCVVSILEGKADELLRELNNHKIDLIVSNFVPTLMESSGLYSRSISKSPVVICGAAKFKGLKKGFPKSLSQAPFILPTSHSKLRHDLEHYFRLSGIHVDIIAETQDTAIQKLMGIEGLGLVPLPLSAMKDYLKKGDLIELGRLPQVTEELFLISASRKIANPISSELMKSFSF